MFYKTFVLVALSVLASAVNAASSAATSTTPTPTGSAAAASTAIPPCVQNCSQKAANENGCTSIDFTCVCTNHAFQNATDTCLKTCSVADQKAAAGLKSALCSNATSSSSGSNATGSVAKSAASATAPATSASASAASSSPSTSNALAGFSCDMDHVVGVAGVALGILGGLTTLF